MSAGSGWRAILPLLPGTTLFTGTGSTFFRCIIRRAILGALPLAAGIGYAVLSTSILVLIPASVIGGAVFGPFLAAMFDTLYRGYRDAPGRWRDNWPNLSTYFKFPQEIRRLIYTTNTIEGFNRQLRKVTKAKTVIPTDDSLLKMLYLAMIDITKKWTGRRQDWSMIHAQMAVYFEDRMPD